MSRPWIVVGVLVVLVQLRGASPDRADHLLAVSDLSRRLADVPGVRQVTSPADLLPLDFEGLEPEEVEAVARLLEAIPLYRCLGLYLPELPSLGAAAAIVMNGAEDRTRFNGGCRTSPPTSTGQDTGRSMPGSHRYGALLSLGGGAIHAGAMLVTLGTPALLAIAGPVLHSPSHRRGLLEKVVHVTFFQGQPPEPVQAALLFSEGLEGPVVSRISARRRAGSRRRSRPGRDRH